MPAAPPRQPLVGEAFQVSPTNRAICTRQPAQFRDEHSEPLAFSPESPQVAYPTLRAHHFVNSNVKIGPWYPNSKLRHPHDVSQGLSTKRTRQQRKAA